MQWQVSLYYDIQRKAIIHTPNICKEKHLQFYKRVSHKYVKRLLKWYDNVKWECQKTVTANNIGGVGGEEKEDLKTFRMLLPVSVLRTCDSTESTALHITNLSINWTKGRM